MNKGGFSWERLSGYSAAKAKVSRKIGIPLTKSGRDQKIGRIVSKGCLGMLAIMNLPILILFIMYFKTPI
ncbi:hypothetical protein BZARG_1078 [Bizionia argentinensis JUB59]|uniref:Uncharacterized protein n=1 Tax=Bizionia argentinensis JUB59 TaxID=1046627 RepID=G2EEH7_9FLAO|nr:hypothetical protein [Bizionia argentinensis]EGV43184.1 hypothetical protein BZARG_1078 [Bizionia argentinensis JUB59]